MSMRSAAMATVVGVMLSACGESTPTPSEGEKNYKLHCLSCHGAGGVGGIGPNITFSTTAGIADWSQAQLLTLVRTGVDNEGMMICDSMNRFSATQLPDDKVALIYAYLKTLKNDTVNKGASCP